MLVLEVVDGSEGVQWRVQCSAMERENVQHRKRAGRFLKVLALKNRHLRFASQTSGCSLILWRRSSSTESAANEMILMVPETTKDKAQAHYENLVSNDSLLAHQLCIKPFSGTRY